MATAEPERETPFLDAYVPELGEIKASLRQSEASVRQGAARLRLVRPSTTPSVPPSEEIPLSTIKATAERFRSTLLNLEHRARTTGIDFEAVIYELITEEQSQLSQTIGLDSDREEILRIATQYREFFKNGTVPKDKVEEVQQYAHEVAEMVAVQRTVYEAYKICRQNLERLRDERLREYATKWEKYLSDLDLVVSAGLAAGVRALWGLVRSEKLWPPTATPRDESLLMLWDRGKHHLEIEVFPGGTYDWFYRNRSDNSFTGGEATSIKKISAPLRAAIRKTRKGK